MNALLQVSDVAKSFGGVQAVRGTGFHVDDSELFAVIGPNGAGKTTTLNLVTGLVRPDAGSVVLAGQDVTRKPAAVRASAGMARTLQKAVVFPGLTVLENIMLGHAAKTTPSVVAAMLGLPSVRRWNKDAREKAEAIADRLGLHEWSHHPAAQLPLGLQRLVEIGRAWATEPKILLLDEPAAGLAHEEVDRLADVLRLAATSGVAVCLVEHNMRLVMGTCNRILVVHQGAPLFEGTPAQVQNHPEVISAYLGSSKPQGEAHAHD